VSEPDAIRALRRQLGRRLAEQRKNAGYAQREFARRISYARSTLSTVESGVQRAGRTFWQACDHVLATGGQFEQGYDQILAQQAAERHDTHARAHAPADADRGLRAAAPGEALRAYWALGWPTVADGDVIELVTGTVLDALAVPRTAGTLAASWWQGTGGTVDQIRGLPALPNPGQALAVITCAGQSFFLTAAGSFPWASQDHADIPRTASAPLIDWHSAGSRIPAPPGTDRNGEQATWAHLPSGRIQLPAPVMLLDLLAKAMAATSRGTQILVLSSGVRAVPFLDGR
jgi:transcriptional regulator with XRE-family HTH domain